MFSNLGMGEIAALVVVGLVILGPERLPGAVSWVMNALKQVRDYATGAQQQLKNEMGDDFEQFREPLQKLAELRGMTPTAIVTKHLLDGDDSLIRDLRKQVDDTKGVFTGAAASLTGAVTPPPPSTPGAPAPTADAALPERAPTMPRPQQPLTPGERPPFDPDAT